MEFNKPNFDAFRADFNKAMADLKTKYNVDIDMKNISYTDTHFTFKTEVVKKNLPGGVSKAQMEWNQLAQLFGTKKEYFGMTVKLQDGTSAVISGIASKSHKYPVIVTAADGRRFKMTTDSVNRQLGKAPATPTLPAKFDLSNVTVSTLTSVGTIVDPPAGSSRQEQVNHYVKNGLTSASEIAKILGTNASYVSRLMK